MKAFIEENKKIFAIAIAVLVFAMVLTLFYFVVVNISGVWDKLIYIIKKVYEITSPVIVGFVIAYLLKRPCRSFCSFLSKHAFVKNEHMRNSVGVVTVYIFFVIVVVVFMALIIPNTIENIITLFARLKELKEPFEEFVLRLCRNRHLRYIAKLMNIKLDDINLGGMYKVAVDEIRLWIKDSSSAAFSFMQNTVKIMYNFSLGVIIALYISLEEDALLIQIGKVLRRIFKNRFELLKEFFTTADKIFANYFYTKITSSFALGGVSLILCLILNIDYPLSIGVVTAVFNLIPIFGPWIGAGICVLFTLLGGLSKAFWVIIISIFVQILDANFVQPVILGSGINLSEFWSLVSVVVFGNFAGIFGMVISMPTFALIKKYVARWVSKGLKNEN